jgi:hypothetical protein
MIVIMLKLNISFAEVKRSIRDEKGVMMLMTTIQKANVSLTH